MLMGHQPPICDTRKSQILESRHISWLGIVLQLLVSGCVHLEPRSAEEVVTERAIAQMNALTSGDFDKALSFATPGYQASSGALLYRANHAGAASWTDWELKWVRCDEGPEPESCQVRFLLRTNAMGAVPGGAGMVKGIQIPWDKQWILIDGSWYQYQGASGGIGSLRGSS